MARKPPSKEGKANYTEWRNWIYWAISDDRSSAAENILRGLLAELPGADPDQPWVRAVTDMPKDAETRLKRVLSPGGLVGTEGAASVQPVIAHSLLRPSERLKESPYPLPPDEFVREGGAYQGVPTGEETDFTAEHYRPSTGDTSGPSGLPEPDMAQELMWAWVRPLADAGFGDQAGVRAFAAKVAQFQASVNDENNLRANPEVFMSDGKSYLRTDWSEKLTKLSNNNTTKFEALLVEGQKLHEELGLQPAIVNSATLLEDMQRRNAYDIFSTNYFNPTDQRKQQEARLGMAQLAVETAQRHGADAAMAISALETVWGVTEEQKELIRSKLRRPSTARVDYSEPMGVDVGVVDPAQEYGATDPGAVIENNTSAIDHVNDLLALNVANQKLSGDQAFEILQGNWNLAIQALYPSGGGPAVDISEFLRGMSTAYVSGELTFAQAMDQMNNQMSVIQEAQQERTRRTDDARTEYIRRRENLASGLQGIDDREEAKKRDLFKMLMGLNLPPSAVGATLGGAGVVHDIAQRAGVESPEPAQIGGPINFPSEFPEFDESRQRLVESVDVGDSETAFIRDWLNQGVS